MEDINIKEWLTSSKAQRSTSSTSRRWGGRGFLGSQKYDIPVLGEPLHQRRNAGEGRIRRGGVKEVAPAPCRCLGFGVPGVLQHLLLLGGDGLHAVLQDNCSSFD